MTISESDIYINRLLSWESMIVPNDTGGEWVEVVSINYGGCAFTMKHFPKSKDMIDSLLSARLRDYKNKINRL